METSMSVQRRTSAHGRSVKPRIYVFCDDPAGYDMPRKQYIKLLRTAALLAIEESPYAIDTDKMGFDDRAGCGCGCSPGFVLNNQKAIDVDGVWTYEYDAYVTIHAIESSAASTQDQGELLHA